MYFTPKEQALLVNDSDSVKGIFSSEKVTENDAHSSEEALIS
jgi:hypothetical protein